MDKECGTHGRRNLKNSDFSEHLNAHGKIIAKYTLKKWDGIV